MNERNNKSVSLFHGTQRANGTKSNKESSTASSSKSYGSYKQLTQNQKVYPSSSTSSNSKSSGSNSVNNNNSTSKNNNNENRSSGSIVKTASVKRNSPTNAQPARSFQYESFHVFNWDEYLKVGTFLLFKLFHKKNKRLID